YQHGEHARHIHWRSSVKADKLIVMEYEKEERRRITLALENSFSNGPSKNGFLDADFEKSVILAASLATRFLHDGFEVALITCSGHIEHGAGSEHSHRIMRALALIELRQNGSPGLQLANTNASPVLAIMFRDSKFSSRGNVTALDVRSWEISE